MRTPRRIVTGHTDDGRSIVLLDDGPGRTTEAEAGILYELWATDCSPAPITRDAPDPSGRPIQIEPLPYGTVIRVCDFAPDRSSGEANVEGGWETDFAAIGSPAASSWRPGLHPGMHRTETVDYGIVLEGEVDLVLEEGEVHLTVGDVVVQRGTSHAWVNRSGRLARMAFVLVDGRFDPGLEKPFQPTEPAG